jgi:hypothetical protein
LSQQLGFGQTDLTLTQEFVSKWAKKSKKIGTQVRGKSLTSTALIVLLSLVPVAPCGAAGRVRGRA